MPATFPLFGSLHTDFLLFLLLLCNIPPFASSQKTAKIVVHSHILEVQRKAHQAYTQKDSNRRQIIDIFESTSKTLLEISNRFEVIEPHLERAKQGVEQFKKSYEAGDENWQDFLTRTEMGKEIQAIYLGIKPLMTIYKDEVPTEIMVSMLMHYANEDFTVLDMRNSGRNILIFSESSVERVLTTHKDYFPVDPSESEIPSYISDLGHPPKTQSPEQLEVQRGLLHGFPLNAPKQFAQYGSQVDRLIDLYDGSQPLSEEDRALLGGYLRFRNRDGSFQYSITNKFRDDHQEEIGKLLTRHFPDMDEKARQYILALRYVELPGFVYTTDNPASDEDRAFAQKVHDIFEISGMDSFLQQILNK